MLDGGDEHDRLAYGYMRVGPCQLDAQAQQLQAQRGVLYLTRQVRQRAFVHWAGVGALQLVARQQVFAEGVRQRMQLMPREAQLLMDSKSVEPTRS